MSRWVHSAAVGLQCYLIETWNIQAVETGLTNLDTVESQMVVHEGLRSSNVPF